MTSRQASCSDVWCLPWQAEQFLRDWHSLTLCLPRQLRHSWLVSTCFFLSAADCSWKRLHSIRKWSSLQSEHRPRFASCFCA